MTPTVRCGDLAYEWIDGWGPAADPDSWPHRGLVTLASGDIAMYEAGARRMQIVAPDGTLRHAVTMPVAEAHGMTYDRTTGVERIWLADAANQLRPDAGYAFPTTWETASVVAVSPHGTELQWLARPEHEAYREGAYRPTAVAVVPGSGDIWVADGYGQSLVHRFAADGSYRGTLDGTEGAGRSKRATSCMRTHAAARPSSTSVTGRTPGSRCMAPTAATAGSSTPVRSRRRRGSPPMRTVSSSWSSSRRS